jgi:hypothetical protein
MKTVKGINKKTLFYIFLILGIYVWDCWLVRDIVKLNHSGVMCGICIIMLLLFEIVEHLAELRNYVQTIRSSTENKE